MLQETLLKCCMDSISDMNQCLRMVATHLEESCCIASAHVELCSGYFCLSS